MPAERQNVDDFVRYEKIKWSEIAEGEPAPRAVRGVRRSRRFAPACTGRSRKRHLFFDRILNEEVYQFPQIFPTPPRAENIVIARERHRLPRSRSCVMISSCIADITSCAGRCDAHQCFPFYVYDEDGTNRRENITDWALKHFREHYGNKKITKWDIFYYVYGLLHHPGYRAAVRREPETRIAADSAGPRLPRLRHGRREAGPAAPGLREAGAVAAGVDRNARRAALVPRGEDAAGQGQDGRSR